MGILRKLSCLIVITAAASITLLFAGCAEQITDLSNDERFTEQTSNAGLPDEPPSIKATAGDMEIPWVVGKNMWNGAIFDRLDNFQWIMSETTFDELPHILNGEAITIRFNGDVPDSVTLREFILRENGDMKYNIDGMDYDISFEIDNETTFTIEPNFATALSSYSGDYEPGNTIKGYRLICGWGDNEAEYAFIIRGDAAVTMISARSAETTLHEAFYHVFQAVYEFDTGLNSEIKYIAVDMTEVFENERKPLLASLQSWSVPNGYELLVDTYEGLVASGLIISPPDRSGFMEGLLFSFYDASFDDDTLTVMGMKYRGPLAAVAAVFTVRFVDGDWIIEEPDGWMMA